MALVDMTVVEQRYRAVLAVERGEPKALVAAAFGVSRQTLHTWLRRYAADGLGGLIDRSHRPDASPHQTPAALETRVCEIRREHPRWGPRRIAHELARTSPPEGAVVSRTTVHRILRRNGLIDTRPRKRPRESYIRWEREAPMALWQLDIVGGVLLVDGTEAKVVTGVDDHSRFVVIAAVVARATGRAVCLALVEALRRYGIPDEVLTDNGKQFTDRFGRGGEVLFDRICRDNGITHRLTQPASPTTTGKIERFHQTLRRELLRDHPPFDTLLAAQAAIDTFITSYNTERPHQGIGDAYPVDRFAPGQARRESEALIPLRVPAHLDPAGQPAPQPASDAFPQAQASQQTERATNTVDPAAEQLYRGGPVEFERIVPASGNLAVLGKQFWLGPLRAGLVITFWADTDLIHLTAGGARIKTVRSPYGANQLAALAAAGGRPAGPSPLPPPDPDTAAIEVDRTVSRSGTVALGGRLFVAAEVLGGRRVTIRIEEHTLLFFDPTSRELLRTRPNPLTFEQARHLRGARPAGPPPRPTVEPITVQRRASNTGVIAVVRQFVSLGRTYAHTVVDVHVSDTTLTIELPDGQHRTVRRTTTDPVRRWKVTKLRTPSVS
ncbi:MAG: hypothetical protein QOJ30_3409 [Pseudonocardiales bacterium]|nr:hypothetical protein [Pseudonocardiales bacterium]